LLAEGYEVVGLDAFIPYYPRVVKEQNLQRFLDHPRFTFYERDLRTADLAPVLDGVEVVFHLAAMGGLLLSWTDFDLYMTCNIQATQRLLEAARISGQVRQIIYASTSSVYGREVTGPETTPPHPASPYGITKLAAENLVQTYQGQFGLPATILRYFSVYGPRQRPDMGYNIFIDRILRGQPITIWGDGNQLRGNTYVGDIVQATILAHQQFTPGAIYNVGGAEEINANQVLRIVQEITGCTPIVQYGPSRPGEQSRALADTRRIQQLGFMPRMPLREGLAAQIAWQRALIEDETASRLLLLPEGSAYQQLAQLQRISA
jgi:nucleoside-diphosphate-sugar epimerase